MLASRVPAHGAAVAHSRDIVLFRHPVSQQRGRLRALSRYAVDGLGGLPQARKRGLLVVRAFRRVESRPMSPPLAGLKAVPTVAV